MKVRLTRKLADEIDGVDLKGHVVGDVFELPPRKATLLMAESWAMPERRTGIGRSSDPEYCRRVEDRDSAPR